MPTAGRTPAAKKLKKPRTPEDHLVRSPLYQQELEPSDCAQPPRPLPRTRKAERRYLRRVVDCMAAAYSGPVRAAGFTLTKPGIHLYLGTIQTPCGEGLAGYPVFYCSANQAIYSSAGSTAEYGASMRLGGYWIVFHEYAHHVQRRIGVLDAAYTRDESALRLSRRIELQADCMMGMTSASVRSVRLNEDDRAEMTSWRTLAADKIHGKTASQLYWVRRGFGSTRFGRCSTWTATKHIS